MKRLLTAIVLLVLIISVSTLSLYDLREKVDHMNGQIDAARSVSPDQASPQELSHIGSELRGQWEEMESRLVLYINHGTLDHITQIFAELPALAAHENYAEFYGRMDIAAALLDDLWKASLPSYRTLL